MNPKTPPCYHARDVAKYRCVQESARLLLGSATPTVETSVLGHAGATISCALPAAALQRAPACPG